MQNFVFQKIKNSLLDPIRACKKSYLPLLLIYFSYGASGFSAIALQFWEKEFLTLSPAALAQIAVWAMVPWTLKMIVGQMVDSVPIFGSRRRVYIFLGAIFLVFGTVLLASFASGHEWVSIFGSEFNIYLLAAVCSATGFVIQDVTADTMSTEVVDRRGKTKSQIQAEVGMVQVLGRIALSGAIFLTAGLGGILAQYFEYSTVFWMGLVIPAISVLGALFVRLEKTTDPIIPKIDWKIFGGGLFFAVFSVVLGASSIPFSTEIVFFVSLALLLTLLFWVTDNLKKDVRKALFFAIFAIFIFRAVPGVGVGYRWFAIDELGFDAAFFGVLAQMSAGISVLVLWLFSSFIVQKPVRTVLLFLIGLETLMSLPDLFLVLGWHEVLGVSARTIALFDTAAGAGLVPISMVVILSLIAFHAPAGRRGTWFAIGASFINLALAAGNLGTKYLNDFFQISRGDYANLPALFGVAIVIGFFVPLAGVLGFLRRSRSQMTEQDFR